MSGWCPSREAAVAAQEFQGPAQGRTVQLHGADVVVHFGTRHPGRLSFGRFPMGEVWWKGFMDTAYEKWTWYHDMKNL